MWNVFPIRKLLYHSHAHVLPFLFEHTVSLRLTTLLKHTRLVVVHHLVVSGVVQLLSRMRMHLQSVVSLFELYRASTGADVRLSFSCAKHLCCACPHAHSFYLLRRSRIGFVIPARCGVNFTNWLIIPRNRRIPLTYVGSGMSIIALTLS